MHGQAKEQLDVQNNKCVLNLDIFKQLLNKETREKEKIKNAAEMEDIDREIKELVYESSLDLIKDIDKVEKMAQSMHLLSEKIDEIENVIEITVEKNKEIKKETASIKQAKKRVEDALEILEKLYELMTATESLERIATKTMLKVEDSINKQNKISDEMIRLVYEWICAYKQAKKEVNVFIEYSFYSKIKSIIDEAEDRLIVVANLLAQWWICELVTDIPEYVQINDEEKKTSYVYKEIVEARKFALSNKVLIRTAEYIYDTLERKEEYLQYVNSARKRELKKICKVTVPALSPVESLQLLTEMLKEFLVLDGEVKKILAEKIDLATEDYDRIIKKRMEKEISMVEKDSKENYTMMKDLKGFFSSVSEAKLQLKETVDVLIEVAYRCITKECTEAEKRIESIKRDKAEEGDKKEKILTASSEILVFLKKARKHVKGIYQAENELDDIILKCANSLIKKICTSFVQITPETAMSIKGFAQELKDTIRKELTQKYMYEDVSLCIDQKLPELAKIEEAEQNIIQQSEKQLKMQIDDLIRQIKIKITKMNSTSDITLFSSKAASIFEEYKKKVDKPYLQSCVEKIISEALQYLPRLMTYSQIDALEADFAILYKSVQYLNLENDSVKKILKVFTEIDYIRKKNKKELSSSIDNDLKDLFRVYNIN